MILHIGKSIGRAILQVTFAVLLVMLVALALYVSLGRQLAPMIGNYTGEVEQRLSDLLGADIEIDSIDGEWERFGPRVEIRGLRIAARNGGDAEPLLLEHVSIAPDMPASLRQLRPVLGRTTLRNLDLTLYEQENGGWSLAGIASAGSAPVAPAQILEWLKSLALLEVEQTRLAVHHRTGQVTRFTDARLHLQSLDGRHAVTLNATQDGLDTPLRVQGELTGDNLEQMQGELYVAFPGADYSAFVHGLRPAGITIDDATLSGEL